MEPARSAPAEDLLPVDVTGFKLRNCRVAAVRAPQRRAQPKTAFGKVEAIAHATANAVILDPAHHRLLHATLIDQVLQQAANRVVGKRGDDACVDAKTPLEAACHVVLTAAFG